MAENFAGKYATDTMVTTETYSDPRAKEAASDFNDILYVTGTTTCQYSRTLSTYTEYGTYTRETVQEAFCPCPSTKASAAAQESPSSWKRKLSFTSLFRRRSSEKRPVDLMEPSPSPQSSPASNKTFFSAIQFQRPGMIRRNAWIGRPKESVGEPESADVLITSTEQFAAAETHVTFVEPQCEAAAAGQRRLIDVSNTQEKAPRKGLELHLFHRLLHV